MVLGSRILLHTCNGISRRCQKKVNVQKVIPRYNRSESVSEVDDGDNDTGGNYDAAQHGRPDFAGEPASNRSAGQ